MTHLGSLGISWEFGRDMWSPRGGLRVEKETLLIHDGTLTLHVNTFFIRVHLHRCRPNQTTVYMLIAPTHLDSVRPLPGVFRLIVAIKNVARLTNLSLRNERPIRHLVKHQKDRCAD